MHDVVILTGAAISAESGFATFLGPDGLCQGRREEDTGQLLRSARWMSAFDRLC